MEFDMQLMRRRVGQVIRIQLSHDLDPATPIGEVFAKPVGVMLIHSSAEAARFAVYADPRLLVIEEELVTP